MTADQIAKLRIVADKARMSPNDYDEGCLLHELLDAAEDVEVHRDELEAQCDELDDIAEELEAGEPDISDFLKRVIDVCGRIRGALTS